ncbi:hypothetical protein ACF8QD_07145 [Aeromonas media]|uniref:hypothetical protein n=1 Tax=Aeromonas media TaxID=651 RepID=UPI000FA53BD5
MNTKKITRDDLSQDLIDHLNAQQALINALAARVALSDKEMQAIKYGASDAGQRAKAKAAEDAAHTAQYEKDVPHMKQWAHIHRFTFENAKDWEAAAATVWASIQDSNGSEHGRPHSLRYVEPTQAELMEALVEKEKQCNVKDAVRRDAALKSLPVIKKKLAALLVA